MADRPWRSDGNRDGWGWWLVTSAVTAAVLTVWAGTGTAGAGELVAEGSRCEQTVYPAAGREWEPTDPGSTCGDRFAS
jgi:hypothetical protein